MVGMAALGVHFFLIDGMEHIEDTNGPDNYALAIITDENIIKQDMGSMNVKKSTGLLNDGITFSSKKFSGVYRLFVKNFFLNSDFHMDMAGFWVNGGFELVIAGERGL